MYAIVVCKQGQSSFKNDEWYTLKPCKIPFYQGEYAGAREMNEEALAMARQTGAGPEEVGMALNNLGLVLQKQVGSDGVWFERIRQVSSFQHARRLRSDAF